MTWVNKYLINKPLNFSFPSTSKIITINNNSNTKWGQLYNNSLLRKQTLGEIFPPSK